MPLNVLCFSIPRVLVRLLHIFTEHLTVRIINPICYYATLDSFYGLWNLDSFFRILLFCHFILFILKNTKGQDHKTKCTTFVRILVRRKDDFLSLTFHFSSKIFSTFFCCKTIWLSPLRILFGIHAEVIPRDQL